MTEGLWIIYNGLPNEMKTEYMKHILLMVYYQAQKDYINEQFRKELEYVELLLGQREK